MYLGNVQKRKEGNTCIFFGNQVAHTAALRLQCRPSCHHARESVVRLLGIFCGLILPLITVPSFLNASDFTGKVVGVIDGDTIDVLHNGQAERIRLAGIDCPEKGQAFGKKAKDFTSSHAFGKQVTVKAHKKDRDGQNCCRCSTA